MIGTKPNYEYVQCTPNSIITYILCKPFDRAERLTVMVQGSTLVPTHLVLHAAISAYHFVFSVVCYICIQLRYIPANSSTCFLAGSRSLQKLKNLFVCLNPWTVSCFGEDSSSEKKCFGYAMRAEARDVSTEFQFSQTRRTSLLR